MLAQIKTEPNQYALEAAQELLEGIQSGEYVGFLAVAIRNKNKNICTTFVQTKEVAPLVAIGATWVLMNDAQNLVKDA